MPTMCHAVSETTNPYYQDARAIQTVPPTNAPRDKSCIGFPARSKSNCRRADNSTAKATATLTQVARVEKASLGRTGEHRLTQHPFPVPTSGRSMVSGQKWTPVQIPVVVAEQNVRLIAIQSTFVGCEAF